METTERKTANKYDKIREKMDAENKKRQGAKQKADDFFNRQTNNKLNRLKGANK